MGKLLNCARAGAAKVLHLPARPDADAALLALGQALDVLFAEHARLHAEAERIDTIEAWSAYETMLNRIQPVADAIMAAPAHTAAGLAVKARLTLWGNEIPLDEPFRDLDFHHQTTRQLIEAVLALAGDCP